MFILKQNHIFNRQKKAGAVFRNRILFCYSSVYFQKFRRIDYSWGYSATAINRNGYSNKVFEFQNSVIKHNKAVANKPY